MKLRSDRNGIVAGMRPPRASLSRGVPLNRGSRRKEALTAAREKMSLLTSAATGFRESPLPLLRMHWDHEARAWSADSQIGPSGARHTMPNWSSTLRFRERANDPLPSRGERGSVLIIVIWIAFGLVSLALYFAHSMSFEMRAADNRVAGMKAEEAIAGAARYVSNVLANAQQPGALPDTNTYRFAAVPVGEATFWLIGRRDEQDAP